MTEYPYAGDGRPYTGPSSKAMAILAMIAAVTFGVFCAVVGAISNLW